VLLCERYRSLTALIETMSPLTGLRSLLYIFCYKNFSPPGFLKCFSVSATGQKLGVVFDRLSHKNVSPLGFLKGLILKTRSRG